jgi:transposase
LNGNSKAEASRQFGVSWRTVLRWCQSGLDNLAPKPRLGRKKTFADDALRREVKDKPSATLKRHAKTFAVSHVAIWRRLRLLRITLKKKRLRYRERDDYQRWLFVRWMWHLAATDARVYYLDECGLNHGLYNPYARAPRGEPVYADIAGSRRGRTSVISASLGHKLVRPFTFDGPCNGEVVLTYFREMLLPFIPGGSVIVLDNASFHTSPELRALVESFGCSLLFLPTYSPDLNPIEHVWATLKKRLMDGIEEAEDKVAFIDKTCVSLCA